MTRKSVKRSIFLGSVLFKIASSLVLEIFPCSPDPSRHALNSRSAWLSSYFELEFPSDARRASGQSPFIRTLCCPPVRKSKSHKASLRLASHLFKSSSATIRGYLVSDAQDRSTDSSLQWHGQMAFVSVTDCSCGLPGPTTLARARGDPRGTDHSSGPAASCSPRRHIY
ncbi:hypothetical protein ROHU_028726 [Labeo rohita]|uniref:Secreted protein n=1 Tax=Labeo rohita TaxID=84645 RepID=A0A498MBH4_LABRO|nr:hypothetical protein ROHU_028708 [Labeo rohita]RXN14447.1 hypothetical protein ROHU_028726 [Labeo rohita]